MGDVQSMRVSTMARSVRLALSAGAVAGLLGQAALAQEVSATAAAPTVLPRVEITGSAIRRIESETALPVQVITREDIEKAGVTTASELMARVSANVGGLTDGASITDGHDQRGFNSANLRGIGTSSTLVLLNGRRMANFASPGDDTGVDLNNIPAAAIQRVEVLLDGASALYGTDAIGGVINFITRKDFQGVELNAYGAKTDEGGAGKRTATLTAGTGDLARDGYNVFAVVDLQRTDALSTSQRKFIGNLRIPERLPHLLSGFTSPANIRLTGAQRDLYETVRLAMDQKVREEIDRKGVARSQIVILEALLKLRQVCCDPRLVKTTTKKQQAAGSAKLADLMQMVEDLLEEDRKILVFSQFTSMLELIEEELEARDIPYALLTGDTKDRSAQVAAFQQGAVPIFLISLKAGGVGLNLTAADTVIHYDPWWNPAAENQATDRAWRIGQDKPVFVYKLIAKGTLEEKIQVLQQKKADLAQSVLAEGESQKMALTQEDLQQIFAPLVE